MNKYIFLLSLFWAFTTWVSAQNITRIEYSIDGFVAEGNGTLLEVPGNTTEMDTEFNIDISDLEHGNHTIHFRAMNEEGVWSFAAERSFYIPEPPITEGIVAVVYSIDEMVKEGDGNLITLQNGTNQLDSTIQFDIGGLDPGLHNIYMRAKNKMGVWSMPAQRSFVIAEPDTARIENIFYRIYNDEFESVWMTASVDPSRKNVDSTILVSAAGLDFNENYSIEFFARNNQRVRSFSVFLNDLNLRQNNAPESLKEMLELTMSVNQHLQISMDSLFQDADVAFGDSLAFLISDSDNPDIFDFASWNTPGILSLTPIAGQNKSYTFWLKTTDLASESDSVQVMLTVTGATGVNSKVEDKDFLIYPNPAKDYVRIKTIGYDVKEYKMHLISATGQLLSSVKVNANEYTLDLENFSSGLYYIVFKGDDFTLRKKLVRY